MSKLERRRIRYSHLSEALEDVRTLAGRGYERAGKWSLEQNLNHLNKSLNLAFEPVDWKLPRLIRPLLRWLLLGRMDRLGSRAFRGTANAPDWLQPDDALELASQLAEFERLTERIESIDAELSPNHPVFGRVNTKQWQIVSRWHCAHHLSHLIPRS